jgi:hypothetical protein
LGSSCVNPVRQKGRRFGVNTAPWGPRLPEPGTFRDCSSSAPLVNGCERSKIWGTLHQRRARCCKHLFLIPFMNSSLSERSSFRGDSCCASQAVDVGAGLNVAFVSVGSHERSRIWGIRLVKPRSTLAPSSWPKAERDCRGGIIASSDAIGPNGRGSGMAPDESSIHGKGRRFGEPFGSDGCVIASICFCFFS